MLIFDLAIKKTSLQMNINLCKVVDLVLNGESFLTNKIYDLYVRHSFDKATHRFTRMWQTRSEQAIDCCAAAVVRMQCSFSQILYAAVKSGRCKSERSTGL